MTSEMISFVAPLSWNICMDLGAIDILQLFLLLRPIYFPKSSDMLQSLTIFIFRYTYMCTYKCATHAWKSVYVESVKHT